MEEIICKLEKEKDGQLICHSLHDFKGFRFLGMETTEGERYFRSNWATSVNNSVFWYPFVGGPGASVYTTIGYTEDLRRLVKEGVRFFLFSSAEEMYKWLAGSL